MAFPGTWRTSTAGRTTRGSTATSMAPSIGRRPSRASTGARSAPTAGRTPALLLAALTELEGLSEQMDRPSVYAGLLHAAKTDDPRHGALLAHTRERRTAINKHLIFFDLEWVKVAGRRRGTAHRRARAGPISPLLSSRNGRGGRTTSASRRRRSSRRRPSPAGRPSCGCSTRRVATIRCPFEHDGRGESLSIQQILAKLYDADRGVRQAAAAGLTKGLQDNARLLTFIFNTLVLDHKSDCELRHFAGPMAPRHLANEIGDDVVEALMTAAERHHATVHRYYRLKAAAAAARRRSTITTATPRSSPTCRAATGRRPGGSSRRATRRSARGPAASSASSSRRAGSTPSCGRASAAAPSAAARCPASIPTS